MINKLITREGLTTVPLCWGVPKGIKDKATKCFPRRMMRVEREILACEMR